MLKKSFLLLLPLVALVVSCVPTKQLTYFQGVTAESAEEINKHVHPFSEPRVKINDALIINVSALDLETVIPYNLPSISYETPASSTVPTQISYQYYTVDLNGDIDFPVLGKLHVEGLTRSEVVTMIENKLKGQLVEPMVTVRFLHSRVTVLGEVRSPGTYALTNGKMTVLEALGRAGDLTQYGRRDNVLITRENNGKLEFARLDLRSDEIFTSPYFYLQSNDVIMVSPNQARTTSNQSIGLWLSLAGTLSSAATVVVTVLTYQARTTGN